MQWEEVRQAYPEKWVVLEAIESYSQDNIRVVKDMAVLDCFDDSMQALRRHAELHKQKPDREFYFFHTSRENLDIHEKKWTGLRKV
ncbi:hypothetical protein ELQ35_05965 [Peribacillus cavernae]|uniref:Uncharacterized protein n=1 Tax=Peribacillus cavernae TaxID=1674310 RepID=A0A3S1B9C6_9BACI|nr:hypothetical protein [Peribacillus cavernae]MDQ0220663.1 hypothetical protein [Peribacillus cavernae]RUQ31117.1 hypothetical protein ELQ35_05965 [Peribacillus cavernae]